MTDAYARFATHAEELQSKYSGLRLSEADTRSYLVEPVLRLIGYEGVEHLRREVAVPATKESLDYELLVSGEPTAIVEAKAIRQRPTDQHAAQCVQYASILGVRWCFITNGVEWLLYDAHAKGPLADKRVAAIRLDGDDESLKRAWDVLSLFTRGALERSDPLAGLLVERVLIDELGDPTSATVNAVRKALRARFGERVNGSVIVAAAERLMLGEPKQPSQQTPGDTMERSEPPPRRRRAGSEPVGRKRVTLADLACFCSGSPRSRGHLTRASKWRYAEGAASSRWLVGAGGHGVDAVEPRLAGLSTAPRRGPVEAFPRRSPDRGSLR
jgi:hypothetical protein